MDRISLLPDDVILNILSLLPSEDVINTNFLSKRWRNLWKLVPKLNFSEKKDDHGRFLRRYVGMYLILNAAPVLESLHFRLIRHCSLSDVDVGDWIQIGVERGLRELSFNNFYLFNEPIKLPQSLYTCGTLVVLKLTNVSLVDVRFPVRFQLLKTLLMHKVIFLDDESPQKLLSSCPVLEDLFLQRRGNDNVTNFHLTVPWLQKFNYYSVTATKLVMNMPSLKYFKTNYFGPSCVMESLPEIVEACIQTSCFNLDDMLRSLASVKRLLLCAYREHRYRSTGTIFHFHQLTHLEFCTSKTEWSLLMSLLQHSPKLRSLKLNEMHYNAGRDLLNWNEPNSVPESLMFGLETFEWRKYRGLKGQRELATYILKHSRRLKMATFSPRANKIVEVGPRIDKDHMIMELESLPRGSTECELVFA